MKMVEVAKPKLRVYKPPNTRTGDVGGKLSVFLAGSIEMGKAEDWQTKLQKRLLDKSVVLFNPRRDDWDSSWKQTIEDTNFLGQVTWEYNHLCKADLVFMYFDPATQSPISLMELGMFAESKDMIVVCPDGFWRKGNVEFVCKQFDIPLFNSFDEGVEELLNKYVN